MYGVVEAGRSGMAAAHRYEKGARKSLDARIRLRLGWCRVTGWQCAARDRATEGRS